MNRRFRKNIVLWFIGGIVFIASVSLLLWSHSTPVPTYEGKNVAEWFYGPEGDPGLGPTMEAATEAYRKMGDSAMPFLIGKAKGGETSLDRLHNKVYPRLPKFLQTWMGAPRRVAYDQMIACHHLVELRGLLSPLHLRELGRLISSFSDTEVKRSVYHLVVAPAAIQLEGADMKKRLFVPFLEESEFHIQLDAAVKLSVIDSSFTNGIPVLVSAITNHSLVVSSFPARSLGNDLKAKMAQWEAHRALLAIDPEMAERFQPPEDERISAANIIDPADRYGRR